MFKCNHLQAMGMINEKFYQNCHNSSKYESSMTSIKYDDFQAQVIFIKVF